MIRPSGDPPTSGRGEHDADILINELAGEKNLDEVIPQLAKNAEAMSRIDSSVRRFPTKHHLILGDARRLDALEDKSVHLVVTSPPYWTLKRYNDHPDQLGHVADYEAFVDSLNTVWRECYRTLVPGGRIVCVVGDVCLSRRSNNGRHTVVPLHATILEHCRRLGFDNLASIFWHKIANANYEVAGNTAGFLGKPYEPNAVIKNDVEFILMQRKPGGYRSPTTRERILSIISSENYQRWNRQIWTDVTGASTRTHPAPYPSELAERLVRMFSFAGDTVLDPFLGTGTTSVAAARWGRNSVGVEIDEKYLDLAFNRLTTDSSDLFRSVDVSRSVSRA